MWKAKRDERMQLERAIDKLRGAERHIFDTLLRDMGPLKQWPVTQMRQMMSKHLAYQGRKSLTCFVLVISVRLCALVLFVICVI